MVVGILSIRLHLHAVNSLKQKRSIVKSVIGRLQSKFNVSVSEIDHQDNKTAAQIGLAVITNDTRFLDQQLDRIIDFIRKDGRFYLGRIDREIF